MSETSSEANAGPQLVIWGTDVVVSHCKEKFKSFLERYVEEAIQSDEQFDGMDINEPLYLQRLEEVGSFYNKSVSIGEIKSSSFIFYYFDINKYILLRNWGCIKLVWCLVSIDLIFTNICIRTWLLETLEYILPILIEFGL